MLAHHVAGRVVAADDDGVEHAREQVGAVELDGAAHPHRRAPHDLREVADYTAAARATLFKVV